MSMPTQKSMIDMVWNKTHIMQTYIAFGTSGDATGVYSEFYFASQVYTIRARHADDTIALVTLRQINKFMLVVEPVM
jgi:hypothetical protein